MKQKNPGLLKKLIPLFCMLLVVLVLRLPNFSEPYWYGDEAIYLTVGTGIRNGLKLYTNIIDHKTPIIYYLATTPTQYDFRLLNLAWMLATTSFFYLFALKFFKKSWSGIIATFVFVLATSLPMLEGNIPNGELFVMGFVLLGAFLFSQTKLFANFFHPQKVEKGLSLSVRESLLLYGSGVFIGLGILTKVPALLDFGSFLVISWFFLFNTHLLSDAKKNFKKRLTFILLKSLILIAGVITPILLSIIYFTSLGSGQDYFDYGLLYNIRYSGSWHPDFPNQFVAKIFTLPGKTAILALFILLLTFFRKQVTPRFQFLAAWFSLSFFAALLSNRPYPHYLLQLVPSFSLLVGYLLEKIPQLTQKKTAKPLEWLLFTLLIAAFITTKNILDFSIYPTVSYYERFIEVKSGKISQKEYDESFNWLVKENYQVAQLIHEMKLEKMFIWGTNPMLYAQTQTVPTSRFTVSFHIKDFNDYERTFTQIQNEQPQLIIVMNDETTPFPQLEEYLDEYYLPNYQYQTMTLYLRHDNE